MKGIVAAFAVVVVLWSSAPLAFCVTNGALDYNRHPEVGTIVAEYKIPGVKSSACTGTLISPTVFLTAGHCIFLLQNVFGAGHGRCAHVFCNWTFPPSTLHMYMSCI